MMIESDAFLEGWLRGYIIMGVPGLRERQGSGVANSSKDLCKGADRQASPALLGQHTWEGQCCIQRDAQGAPAPPCTAKQ